MTGIKLKKYKLCTSTCFDFPVYGIKKTCDFFFFFNSLSYFLGAGFHGNAIELALLLFLNDL